ncbi:hypothetical protein WN48_01890 [Eufriesea mexicana]|nr:hypothetical protein WN48_01890 [Eufriesea mexicana]
MGTVQLLSSTVHTVDVFRYSSDWKHVDQATSDTSGYVNTARNKARVSEVKKQREEVGPESGGCAEGVKALLIPVTICSGGHRVSRKLEDEAVISLVSEEFRDRGNVKVQNFIKLAEGYGVKRENKTERIDGIKIDLPTPACPPLTLGTVAKDPLEMSRKCLVETPTCPVELHPAKS